MFVFFFFKQKTAYEMRISDWSSDVCSSDLEHDDRDRGGHARGKAAPRKIVPAHQEIERAGQDNGEEPFHQHAGDEQVMPHRVAAVAIFAGIVERVLLALLLGYLEIGRAHV